MKFSTASVFAAFSLFAVTAYAAPAAAPVAVAVPAAAPVAAPVAVAAPYAESDLQIINAAVANITGELGELTKVLLGSGAPNDTLTKVENIVYKLVEGIISTLGDLTGLSEATDSINNLLNTAIGELDDLLDQTGLTATLNKEVDSLVKTVQDLLKNVVSLLNGVLSNLLSLNLVGVVVSLLSGLLKTIGGLLGDLL